MNQSLCEISLRAIRNGVVEGRILNAEHLPLILRERIFELFRVKRLLGNQHVVRLLCQPGFFAGFTAIDLHHADILDLTFNQSGLQFDECFLEPLVKTFAEDRVVAKNISDLSVCIFTVFYCPCDQARTYPRMENIWNLLGFCKNLKRLRLVAAPALPHNGVSESYTPPEPVDISIPALEHLALLGDCSFWIRELLRTRLFESIRNLQLHSFGIEQDLYSAVLARCQSNLTALDVVCLPLFESKFYPLPIELPKLSSLSLETFHEGQIVAMNVAEKCPNLATLRLRLAMRDISVINPVTLAQSSVNFQLHVQSLHKNHDISELVEVGERAVELKIFSSFDNEGKLDQVLSCCQNVRSLYFVGRCNLTPFHSIFNDKLRAAKLTELTFTARFPATLLEPLFANCCNLRYLILRKVAPNLDISNHLQRWVDNGARPTLISIVGFRGIHPATVYSLMKASGRDLKRITLEVLVTNENVYEMCLNVLANYCPFVEASNITYTIPCEEARLEQLHKRYENSCFHYDPLKSFRVPGQRAVNS